MSAADPANAVTGLATVFAGLVEPASTATTRSQPRRWIAVYAGVVVTGIPGARYHGFGETYWPDLADNGTNLPYGPEINAGSSEFCGHILYSSLFSCGEEPWLILH